MGSGFGEQLLAAWLDRAHAFRAGEPPPRHTDDDRTSSGYRDLFWTLLRHSFDGIVLNARESRWIIEVSDSFCRLSGYPREELIGRTSVELGLVDPDGVRAEATSRVDSGHEGLYETRLRRKDGEDRWVEFSHQLLGREFILTIVRDVTERRGLEDELRRLADTDPLTGVLNHRRFREEVEREIRESKRFSDRVTFMVIDIDHFKAINDEYGHAVGDEVLRGVAEILQGLVRDTDFVGRIGGDEFAVMLTQTMEGGAERVADAFTQELLRFKPTLASGWSPIEASVGIASSFRETTGFETLLDAADRAMYTQKRR